MVNKSGRRGVELSVIVLSSLILGSFYFLPPLAPALTLILGLIVLIAQKKYGSVFWSNGKAVFIFSSLFWVYLLGLSYTTNLDEGITDVVLKLSFLAFPLIFGVLKPQNISARQGQWVLMIYVALTFLTILICLTRAIFQFSDTHNPAAFFYGELSFVMHASYLSLYVNFALAVITYQLLYQEIPLPAGIRKFYVALIPVFMVFIVLLESKAGLLSLGSLILVVGAYLFFIRKSTRLALISVISSLGFLVLILLLIPGSTARISTAVESVKDETGNAAEHSVGAARIYLWDAAFKAWLQKPLLGHGTGDVDEALLNQYEEQHNQRAIDHHYNPHNQFLQTGVGIGALGLVSLLITILFPMIYGFKKRHLLYFSLGLFLLVNLLVESMFERQAGVMFFAFFNSFIYFVVLPGERNSNAPMN